MSDDSSDSESSIKKQPKTYTVRLPNELRTKLDDRAKTSGASRSAVVQRALRRYLEDEGDDS